MNYDVFISCKHEDYEIAALVYEFLKSKGVSVFIASEFKRKYPELIEYMMPLHISRR